METTLAPSEDTADERAEDRLALRALLRDVVEAINRRDWDALDPLVSPDIFITMIDQVTVRGRDQLDAYITSKLGQFSSVLADLKVDPQPDGLAVFYGETAVLPLTSTDTFVFRNGKVFTLKNQYTAVIVRHEGSWKLVALHGGTNAFNNPISYQTHRLLVGALPIAAAGGAALAWLLNRK